MNRQQLYISTVDEKAHLLAKRYGLGLELAEFCTPWFLDREFAAADALVREKMAGVSRGVIHGPFSELFPCAIDPMIREVAAGRFRQTLRVAAGYGIQKVVFHGGYNPRIYYRPWYVGESVKFWREFMDQVPRDMQLCLENVFEEEPEMLLEILEQVHDPRLGMCLDVGHVNAYSPVSLQQWLERCAPWIRHFHIHNNDSARDTHSGLTEGTIPMEQLLSQIQTLCPEATLTLELPDAEKSVRWLLEVWQ